MKTSPKSETKLDQCKPAPGFSSKNTYYKKLIEYISDAVVILDSNGKFSYASPSVESLLGYNLAQIREQDLFMLCHPEDQALISEKIRICIENPEVAVQRRPVRILHQDGSWRYMEGAFTNLLGDPEIQGIICNFRDISDRVKAERQTRFQVNLLNKIGQAVVATDLRGIISYWNRAAEKIYGWSETEAIGKNVIDLIPANQSRAQSFEIMAMIAEGKTWSGEFNVKHKNGMEFPVLVTDSPVYDEDHKLIGVVGVSTNISERKKGEEKLLELNQNLKNHTKELVSANKGLEQFSYIVSHNLRAPVANIIGLGDLLQDQDYPAEVRDDLLQQLFGNVNRLEGMITDLNDILQVKGDMDTRKELVNLENLVTDITEGIKDLIGEKEIQILTDFSKVKEINAVPGYLHSIFYNLIINSIKYSRPEVSPRLVIEGEQKEDTVLLKFRDNGLGMDLTKKEDQIFGLYKRFHHHIEGKGMGLFMVKTQVEMLGGTITVSSEENSGTDFIIELPI